MESTGNDAPAAERFWVNVFAVLVVVAVLASLALSVREKAHPNSNDMHCRNSLRQLGLAAIQYADDKRTLPSIPRVPSDAGTSYAPRAVRSLVYFNYLDDPETFICRDSNDHAQPRSEASAKDPRRWGWGGVDEPEGAPSPLASAGASDKPLGQLHDLSYGWTRKPYLANGSASKLLAADRAIQREDGNAPHGLMGNHRGYANTVSLGGATTRVQVGDSACADLFKDSGLSVFWDADGESR